MKINKNSYSSKRNIYEIELETHLALFIKSLSIVRPNINKMKVAKEIMEKYIRVKASSQVSATPLMRDIME